MQVAVLEFGEQLPLAHVVAAVHVELANRRADLRHDCGLIERAQDAIGIMTLWIGSRATAVTWTGMTGSASFSFGFEHRRRTAGQALRKPDVILMSEPSCKNLQIGECDAIPREAVIIGVSR